MSKEKEMREAFKVQVANLLASPDRFQKDGNTFKVGLESELAIHVVAEQKELNRRRDVIIAENPDFTDVELGASQIEIRTPPVDLFLSDGVESLAGIYKQRFESVLNSARRQDVSVLRVGANPFLPTIGTPRTDKLKYQLVPDFYNQHRDPRLDTTIGLGRQRVDIGDAAIVSLFQSFQVNIEANSLENACNMMNRSLMIAPYLLAFSGNARYLNCQDTRIKDTRMMSWEISHEDRTICDTRLQDLRIMAWEKSFDVRPDKAHGWSNELRVGLPSRYFRNMEDYLNRAGTFPFILHAPESALAISIGMTWLDARVKFIGDSAIVELRLPSTQPTTEEEILLMLLYVGRLNYSQEVNEILLPINMVQENRLSAMIHGLEGSLWFTFDGRIPIRLPARVGLEIELERAISGLHWLSIESGLDRGLLSQVFNLGSPSDRLGKLLDSIDTPSVTDTEDALSQTKMLIK